MAIDWGAWEGSGSNRLRIGIDVSWEAITSGEAAATATIKVYLDVEGNWSDTQTITMTGSGSGSTTFSNNQNNNSVLRYTDSYTYTYSSSSYGSSPGTRTFGASLSGAFNGATPSNSVTKAIPARPYAAPTAPSNVNTSRTSDSSIKTTWTNNDTNQRPWTGIDVQRDDGANDVWNAIVGTPSGSATSFTDSDTGPNYIYRYRVRSKNSVDVSSYVEGDLIYTTPAAPTNPLRTGNNGANQVITFTDNTSAAAPGTQNQIERSDNGGAWTIIVTLAKNVETWTDTFPASNPSIKFKYRVRSRAVSGAQGTLYSAYSAETTETAGVTTPPLAATNLAPANLAAINPSRTRDFTWQYNSSDTSAQTSFGVQWRVQGAGSWTVIADVASATAKWTSAVGQFPDNSTIEWQVRTKGANAAFGPYSASAFFKTVGDVNMLRDQKRVMRMNMETGQPETAGAGVLPPVGSMMLWPGEVAPPGWLICDGSVFSSVTYPGLASVLIGTTLPFRADEWQPTNVSVTTGVVTPNTGYSATTQVFRHLPGNLVQMLVEMTRTGATVGLANPDHSNQTMGTITSTEWRPILQISGSSLGTGLRNVNLNSTGTIALAGGIADNSFTAADMATNNIAGVAATYSVYPPTAAPRLRWIVKAE